MFQVDLDNAICFLREQLCPYSQETRGKVEKDGTITRPGLHLRLDLNMDDHESGEGRRCFLHLILGGNTNVFACFQEFGSREEIKPEFYENLSNHDSCWRDAIRGYIDKLYFNWAHEIAPDKAPITLDARCYLMCFDRCEQVEYKISPKGDGYHYNLTGIKILS